MDRVLQGEAPLEDPGQLAQGARLFLRHIDLFSRHVLRMPLYGYHHRPLQAILDSVPNKRGHEFLLIFPRQSGKNEAVADLLVYLLNVFQRVGGNVVFAAIGDGVGVGVSDWLAAQFGPGHVTAYKFNPRSKAALGSRFITVVESRRFKYWAGDELTGVAPLTDAPAAPAVRAALPRFWPAGPIHGRWR